MNLPDLIKTRESETVEFKEKFDSTKGRCLKRVDSSNRTMTTQEITQIYLHSTGSSWDKYPAIHCGRFKKGNIVIDDRMVIGTVLEQIPEAMDFIQKNINVEFAMTGKPEREQVWDYPLEALREALINAVCHRDYTILSNIEIRIYEDRLIIWSPGNLPFGITLDELFEPHSSALRNKGLAEVFYDTELIEQWGSGIEKMQKYCLNAGLPEPIFEEYQGFQVVFRKDIYNEDYLHSLNLNERQIKAVMYVKKNGNITNKEYQEVCNTSERTSSRDLAELVSSGLFEQIGITGKGTAYSLRRQRRHNDAIKTPKTPSDINYNFEV